MKIRVAHAERNLDHSWVRRDLTLGPAEPGPVWVRHNVARNEEWIFTHLHVLPNIEHPIRPLERVGLLISGRRELDTRAVIWVPRNDHDRPEAIRPSLDVPEGIHVGGTERIEAEFPLFSRLVLYGWWRQGYAYR